MQEVTTRVIVCAAVKIGSVVIPCVRHWDATCRGVTSQIALTGQEQQGFLDNFGEFLDRKQSWDVARAAGQIKHNPELCAGTLYSKHLY